MKKLPTYIGVFAQDYKTTEKDLRFQCKEALMTLEEEVNQKLKEEEYDPKINQDIANFNDVFSLTQDVVHLTALFIGGKQLKNNKKNIFNEFKNDQKKLIKICALVYVPGFILTGYVSDTDGVTVQNQFPHVTLFLANGAKAVESNGIIQAIDKEHPGVLKKGQFKIQKYSCSYNAMDNKRKIDFAYIIKRQIKVNGVTGNNFVYGRRK